MAKRHVNEFLRTSSGRLAGNGMVHDNYSEESGNEFVPPSGIPKHSKAYMKALEREKEPSSVKVYKLSKEELDRY